jgi:hypothetical protein
MKEENKKIEEVIISFDSEGICPEHDEDLIDELFEVFVYEADKILDTNSNHYVEVNGEINTWNKSCEIESNIISETTIENIISTHIRDIDYIRGKVYENRVEIDIIHHDGTNHYTFAPFRFEQLTIKELKSIIERNYSAEMFNDDGYEKPFSRALKSDLIECIENNELYK